MKYDIFRPLEDEKIPAAEGLILCGGYPEIYAEKLSENKSMLKCIRAKIEGGLPTIAECGGFMYLHKKLEDGQGNSYEMAGVIEGKAYKTERLQRFGYTFLTAEKDNLISRCGEAFPAHEFHYWDSTSCGADMTAKKTDGREWKCCHCTESLYAGFPHLYFYANPKIAESFVCRCMEYGGICE